MKNLYRLLIICLLFTGCSAQKWCEKHYPSEVSDSTWKEIEYVCEHDTIPMPYRAIEWDTTFNFLQDVVLHRVVKDKGLTGTLNISKGKVSLKVESDSSDIYRDYYHKNVTVTNQKKEVKWLPCDKEHRNGWDTFCRWFTPIILLLILIGVIIKCFRG